MKSFWLELSDRYLVVIYTGQLAVIVSTLANNLLYLHRGFMSLLIALYEKLLCSKYFCNNLVMLSFLVPLLELHIHPSL